MPVANQGYNPYEQPLECGGCVVNRPEECAIPHGSWIAEGPRSHVVTESYVQFSMLHLPRVLSLVYRQIPQIECGAGGAFRAQGRGGLYVHVRGVGGLVCIAVV